MRISQSTGQFAKGYSFLSGNVAAMGVPVTMQTEALVLIDVQCGFYSPQWGRRNNPAFEANVTKLLSAWRERGLLVAHVRHDSRLPLSPLHRKCPGNAFAPCAIPLPNELVVVKHVNSAFIGTDLEELLRSAGVTRIILAGLTTDHCVSTTARMAANLGFETAVVTDATATFPRRDALGNWIDADTVHRVSLASLNLEFAFLVSTTEAILAFGSSQGASHAV